MYRIFPSRIRRCGSVVRALRLISVRLPVQIQPMCFCPSGVSAPSLFKSSEAKPAPSSRHGGLPPRDNSFFCRNFKDNTTVYKKWYAEKVVFSPYYFNSGEIKTKLLSWANRGTTKCTLSANDWQQEAIFTWQRKKVLGRCRGFASNCLQSHEGFILDRM